VIIRNLPETVSRKICAGLLWSLIVLSIAGFNSALAQEADTVEFKVTPKQCVTLRQGQPCFVKLRFAWQSNEDLKACVYGIENEELKCWSAASSGSIVMSQTLPGTTEYILIDSEGIELNRATVSVSWVYRRKRSKRRWRLF